LSAKGATKCAHVACGCGGGRAPALRPIPEMLEDAKMLHARMSEALVDLGFSPPVAVVPPQWAYEWADDGLQWYLATVGAPWGRVFTIKFMKSRRWGGKFRPSTPWTAWITLASNVEPLLHEEFHELSHLRRFHLQLPQDEAIVEREAAALLQAYWNDTAWHRGGGRRTR